MALIIKKLGNPENEDALATEVDEANAYECYDRNPACADVFTAFSTLPSYRVPRSIQLPALVRLLRLVNRLSISTKIDKDAKGQVLSALVKVLASEADGRKGSPGFEACVSNAKNIRVEGHLFDVLANRHRMHNREIIEASEENVDQIFRAASRRVSGEEELGLAYWKERHSDEDHLRARLEFYALVQEQTVRTKLEQWSRERFDELYAKHADAIQDLPSAKQKDIERLAGGQEKPIPSPFRFMDVIEVKRGPEAETDHLYCTKDGTFCPPSRLNGWEQRILVEERKVPQFLGWFRNPTTGEDRLAIPYQDGAGTWRTKSVDFLTFHKVGENTKCSIIEPHDISNTSSWCIAKGLATYAETHGKLFARIELTIEAGGKIKRLELNKPSVRQEVGAINSNEALKALFAKLG